MGWGWGLRMSTPRRVLEEIERTNHAGAPAVLTIHPWEIDPNPPRVRLPAGLRFAHYFRLAGFADRLRSILDGRLIRPARRGGRAHGVALTLGARALILVCGLLIARGGAAAEPTVPHVALQPSPDRRLPAAVADAIGATPAFPVAVRVSLDVADAVAVREAEAAISDYEARHLKLWLATLHAGDRPGRGGLARRPATLGDGAQAEPRDSRAAAVLADG